MRAEEVDIQSIAKLYSRDDSAPDERQNYSIQKGKCSILTNASFLTGQYMYGW